MVYSIDGETGNSRETLTGVFSRLLLLGKTFLSGSKNFQEWGMGRADRMNVLAGFGTIQVAPKASIRAALIALVRHPSHFLSPGTPPLHISPLQRSHSVTSNSGS